MQNDLADQSVLYVFADGTKDSSTEEDLKKIAKVRSVIRSKQWCKEVNIRESSKNIGLADSILKGVTEIVNRHDKVIVLEDDLVTARGFLRYMNMSLDKYLNEEKVWQISGFSFPLTGKKTETGSYFLKYATSWGWGTWKRSWNEFDPAARSYEMLKHNVDLRVKFDLDDSYPYSEMLFNQMDKNNMNIDSWAIRWWWSIFSKDKLTLFPENTLIENIGYDASATHTKVNKEAPNSCFNYFNSVTTFPTNVTSNWKYFDLLKAYLKSSQTPRIEERAYRTKLKTLFDLFQGFTRLINKFSS